MRRLGNSRGEGRIGLIISLALLLAGVYTAYVLIPIKVRTYEFYDAMRDLTNFLVYLGEPAKMYRWKIGLWVLLFLGILGCFTYMLKKEYWKDVH